MSVTITNKEIETYCIEKSNQPDKICEELEQFTRANVNASNMLIGKLEASFLGFLIQSHQMKRILEIGTYTGYSALCMASTLPADGELVTLDISTETVNVGKKYWERSPHGKKITSHIGPALESIKKLHGSFDLVFIDADKANYLNYLKATLPLLSPQGIVAIDNCLWSGDILQSDAKEKQTLAIQAVNNFIADSESLYGTLVPIRDGIFLVQKR